VSAEFIGRYSTERMAYPAICLAAESSSITAIMNDYGTDSVFARQVEAHGLAGDVLLCLSTSGRSPNIVAAAAAARDLGVTTWAMTGRGPNKLSAVVDDWIEVDSDVVATVQEAHLALLHILCEAFDEAVPAAGAGRRRRPLR
jgi:D-sedoheptulose 7-phosphate isomerase